MGKRKKNTKEINVRAEEFIKEEQANTETVSSGEWRFCVFTEMTTERGAMPQGVKAARLCQAT